jgi:hypothetical protein
VADVPSGPSLTAPPTIRIKKKLTRSQIFLCQLQMPNLIEMLKLGSENMGTVGHSPLQAHFVHAVCYIPLHLASLVPQK